VPRKGYVSYPLKQIGGLEDGLAEKLKSLRIRTTVRLLEAARNAKGRKALAERTGIDAGAILRLANKAELMQIKGIGSDYTDLLHAAGVTTVRELRTRKPQSLARKLAAANGKKTKVELVPGEKTVAKWIDAAKSVSSRITY
jgi:hypothetical protein